MGGGYYDSFLKEVKCSVAGLAYSFQETGGIPLEEHDALLDIIITDKEIIRISHE
jgi:5-formyltetrahydrofolate cyclo-ligase